MPDPLRLSDLSPARRELVRLCQAVNRGVIEGLEVRQSQPVLDPFPVIVKDVKLDKDEVARPELALADFVLSSEICRFMALLDELRFGTIRVIEVRDGIPRRILLESAQYATANPSRTGRAQ